MSGKRKETTRANRQAKKASDKYATFRKGKDDRVNKRIESIDKIKSMPDAINEQPLWVRLGIPAPRRRKK